MSLSVCAFSSGV
uniref:Uncharacterized protein n=1 Tax=Rhizophora mucronata TaxID=61149 RepID=A0A2P2NPD4_RHIMU